MDGHNGSNAIHGALPTDRVTVLHVFGSAVSDYYWKVSATYAQNCVKSTIDASTAAGYDYVYAQVTPGGRWSFPTNLDDSTLEECANKAVSSAEGLRMVGEMGVDVAVPHMFCLPGMTTYRAMLELIGIPFIGNAPEVMALSTNKEQTKAVCSKQGVPVPRGELLRRGGKEKTTLPLPLVIKPCSEDNSQGISFARDADELDHAIQEAFKFDDEVLVEEFVPLGRELRVAVLEDENGEPNVLLPAIEYHLNDEAPIRSESQKFNVDPKTGMPSSFFKCKRSIPANVDDTLMGKLGDAVRRAHKALGCRDYSLYDFRISPEGEPYMLEACLYCSFAPSSVIVLMADAGKEMYPELGGQVQLLHMFLKRALSRKPMLLSNLESNSAGQALGMKVRRSPAAGQAKASPTSPAGYTLSGPASPPPCPSTPAAVPSSPARPLSSRIVPKSNVAPSSRQSWISSVDSLITSRHTEVPQVPLTEKVEKTSFLGAAIKPVLHGYNSVTAIAAAGALVASAVPTIGLTLLSLPFRSFAPKVEKVPKDQRLTVLVSGAKMSKALFLARCLGRRGHRVVMVETPGYEFVGAQFSRYVAAFRTVPDPRKDEQAYRLALARVCEEERVDVFVPVAAPSIAVPEVYAATWLHETCGVKPFCYEPAECAALDDKADFCQLASGLGLSVPAAMRVESALEAHALNNRLRLEQGDKRWILKPIEYDPVRRNDLFTVPCHPSKLEAYVAEAGISPENPWCGQEMCTGREFNCGAVYVEGQLAAAAVTHSSPSLQNPGAVRCEQIMAWMRKFGIETGITGQTQVDFFLDDNLGEVKAIEYNPRCGSTLMLVEDQAAIADAITLQKEFQTTLKTAGPALASRPLYWFFNELQELARSALTPRVLHAFWNFFWTVLHGRDALFELDDPMPFLACNHLQAPALLLSAAARGNTWRKYDFCIGKVVQENGD